MSNQSKLAETREILLETKEIALRLHYLLEEEKSAENKQRIIAALAALAIVSSAFKAVDPVKVSSPSFSVSVPGVEQVIPAASRNSVVKPNQKMASTASLVEAAKLLFTTPQSLGSRAVGHAEGNYSVSGKLKSIYFGHIDPGNPKPTKNMGFCSDQGRGGGNIDRANAECIKYIVSSLPVLINNFQRVGINPTTFEMLAAADLYNQAAPRHSKMFAAKLAEVRERFKHKNLSEVELIANTRAATFWVDGENTAKGLARACRNRPNPPATDWDCVYGDQLRRVEAIAAVLKREDISLSQPLVEVPKAQEEQQPKLSFRFPQINFFGGNDAQRAPALGPSEQDVLASKLIKHMEEKGYEIARHPREINLVYLRNNKKATDQWTDKLVLVRFVKNTPKIVGEWQATTMPGQHYIKFGKKEGAPFIVPGQYKAWQVGIHRSVAEAARGGPGHEALIQTGGNVRVLRDFDKDGVGDTPYEGMYGINLHGSRNQSQFVGQSSAGCLVVGGQGVGMQGIQEVMKFVKGDRRYISNRQFVFPATIIEAWRLQ